MDTPPFFLELSTMEMEEVQKFEQYTTKWCLEAAKHCPPISEAQQIQMFHETLKGAYYSHLMGHKSSFSEMIMAGKQVDLGIKLGRIEGPTKKGEGESSRKTASTATPTGGRRSKEVSVNAVNAGHNAPQQYSMSFTPAPSTTPVYAPPPPPYPSQHSALPVYYSAPLTAFPSAPQQVVHHYASVPPQTPQYRLPASRTPQPTQQAPAPQGQQGGATQTPVYENPEAARKGKAPAVPGVAPEASSIPQKKVTKEETETFMKIIKASEYKVVEQMTKSPAHISLLALLLNLEAHREALLRVPTAAQIPKETAPERIEETISSIFSNNISFSDDEFPSEGWAHSRALHIVCKYNNFIIGRVMIDNGSALNVCPVSTLKQMNVDFNRIRPSKTAVRAFDGSRREVNGEIDLVIEVGPCSFAVTFQVLDIPNAFRLLLGRPWIHAAGAIPSSLHQRIKFIAEGQLITVKGEEDYAIYKEMVVPYVLLRHNYIPSSGLGARGQRISRPIEIEEYKNMRGLGFRPSCHEIIEARRGMHLHRLAARYRKINRGIPVHPLSYFFPGPPHIVEGLNKDGRVPEIEESLRRLENRQLTFVEPTEEINVGTEEELRILKIGTGLDPTQRVRMIEFLTDYQERFPPKRWHIRRQRAGLLLRIKEEIIKQITAGFLEVCNYSEWVANIVPVEKKDGRVRVCVDYRDLNKASPIDNFPLPHIDVLVDNTARHTLFSFIDGFSGYNQIRMAEEDKIKTTFITIERGIEVDPDKVKAIGELHPPLTAREVRDFLGWLNYIARFIANLTDKCQPLCRLLRKNAAIERDEELRRQSLGCMLGQEDESTRAEHAIYYLSKKFTEGESNYPEIEKICYALVWVMQRLRKYMLYHTIRLLSKADPLKYLLDSPSSMKNISKWRSKVDFPCTNNVAEYEACILGLQAVIDFKVKELEVFGDSMLTIFQTLGQWKTKDAKLVSYHEYLEELAENFKKISFTYTPRIKNQFVDALATLASMVSITKENLIEPLEIEIAKGPAHCDAIEATDKQPWYTPTRSKHRLTSCARWQPHGPFQCRIEAVTLASVTANAVARFLKRDIIARYGVLETIITDNAKNLNNKVIDELYERFKVHHRNSTPYRPQMNDAVEAANKNIKKIIEKMTRMARAFNARVRHHEFKPDDLVLQKVLHITPDSRGKFPYKYDGSFVVKEVFSGGAIILSDMDGTENALPVNADALKKFECTGPGRRPPERGVNRAGPGSAHLLPVNPGPEKKKAVSTPVKSKSDTVQPKRCPKPSPAPSRAVVAASRGENRRPQRRRRRSWRIPTARRLTGLGPFLLFRRSSPEIELARPKKKPPGRDVGPNWSVRPNGSNFWAGLAKQELGRGLLIKRRSESEEDGGDGAAGGGSRPWTPRRRHERAREMALDTADASPRSI
ncbi:hypothetical protein CRG98_030700 [Punica granatum]|uniref:RNA-directed DNA polymerase n=1 Tax=Punica granatum TaxID=22663 RepID=A0A2I0IY67_PUNGR|nr:hypothetical protein CRG98_030700 [Punica granatum]